MSDSVDADDDETPDLASMTKAQLLEYASDHGISGVSSSMLKADIIAVIEAAEA